MQDMVGVCPITKPRQAGFQPCGSTLLYDKTNTDSFCDFLERAHEVTARGLEVQARILPSKADQTEFVPEIVNHFRSPSCYCTRGSGGLTLVDNASCHKPAGVKKTVKRYDGEMVLEYILPYTPELNPVEIRYRETRRRPSAWIFDVLDDMERGPKAVVETIPFFVSQLRSGSPGMMQVRATARPPHRPAIPHRCIRAAILERLPRRCICCRRRCRSITWWPRRGGGKKDSRRLNPTDEIPDTNAKVLEAAAQNQGRGEMTAVPKGYPLPPERPGRGPRRARTGSGSGPTPTSGIQARPGRICRDPPRTAYGRKNPS